MKKNYGKLAAVAVAAVLAAGIIAVPATGANFVKAVDASSTSTTKTVDASGTTSTSTTSAATTTTTTTETPAYTEGNKLSDATMYSVVNQIENSTPGATVNVGMVAEAPVVPSGILLEAAQKDVVVRFDFGTYAWAVNGKSITSVRDINFAVAPSNAVPADRVAAIAGSNPTVQLSLSENGDFGFTATLTYNVGSQYAGKYANLFWYKNDGTFEAISNSVIDANGYSNLQFTHASNYVVVISDKAMGESAATKANTAVSTTTSPKTGEVFSIF